MLVEIAQCLAEFGGCFLIEFFRRGGAESALKGIERRGCVSQQGAYLLGWKRFDYGQQPLFVAHACRLLLRVYGGNCGGGQQCETEQEGWNGRGRSLRWLAGQRIATVTSLL